MQTVHTIEHPDGGKWYHFQYGWIANQQQAMTFDHRFMAEQFIEENLSKLGPGAKVSQLKVDYLRHLSVAETDYDPYGLHPKTKD